MANRTKFVYWGLLAIVAVLVFLRTFYVPVGASTGLDPSWQVGLTEASLRGFVFGRDVTFAYGPLGYLTVGAGIGQAYWQILAFSIALALVISALITYAAADSPGPVAALGFVIIILINLTGVLPIDILSVGFIVALTLPQFRGKQAPLLPALAFGLASGLAILMKFNFGVSAFLSGFVLLGLRPALRPGRAVWLDLQALLLLCVGFAVASSFAFASIDYGVPITAILTVAALGCAAVLLRPSLGRTPAAIASCLSAAFCLSLMSPTFRSFAGASMQIATGYSGAMSLDGPRWELWFALAVFTLLGLAFYANVGELTIPVVAGLCVALFFGYKEGFVRQDNHVIYAFGTAFLISGAIFRLSIGGRKLAINGAVAMVALFALAVILRVGGIPHNPLEPLRPEAIGYDFARFRSAWRTNASIAATTSEGVSPDRLPPSVVASIGSASVDGGPYETSVVLANGFRWNPQPVFQTYSAYTPQLDEMNANHLRVAGADRLLFNWGTVDGRYPLWDQPAATREMLCTYALDPSQDRPVTTDGGNEFLILRHVPDRCGPSKDLAEKSYAWSERIPVPAEGKLVFMKLDVRYTLLGELLRLAFRAPVVNARVSNSQGVVTDYRIIVDNSADGLLVSPLPANLLQFQDFLGERSLPRTRTIQLTTDAKYFFEGEIRGTFALTEFQQG